MGNLRKQIGERIRELRLPRGLSQEQVGERGGVSYKLIGDVERGQGNPTIDWLDAVARGLGVTLKECDVVASPPTSSATKRLDSRKRV